MDSSTPKNSPDGVQQTQNLVEVRAQINTVDSGILELLARRRALSNEIIEQKDSEGIPLRDPRREEEILVEKIRSGRALGLDAHFITKVFHEIIADSIRMQQEYLQRRINGVGPGARAARISFHGIEGSYCYLAARNYFSREVGEPLFLGCNTFEDVVKAAESGAAEFAIVPIENTTSGAMNEVYDLILHSNLSIVGEEKFQLNHCLIGSPGATIGSLKKIYCSPQAVSECNRFLAALPGIQLEYLTDSALSVRRLKDDGNPTHAAIASEEAARLFGLEVLQTQIANQRDNFNRYLVLARTPSKVDPRIPSKTSLVISTAQQPGALVEALLIFRENGINLTKLESRPIAGNPWEEMFYIDFEGNSSDERVKGVLSALTNHTRFIKILGCYPSAGVTPTPLPAAGTAAELPASKSAEVRNEAAAAPKPAKKSKLLASRDQKAEDTVIEVKGVKIGGSHPFIVMAGPCSVESYDQIMACAQECKEHGATILRGGCFKPRTSPYSFQGLGLQGLDMMVEAGRNFGLPIVTEVMAPEDVEPVAAKADILQIGARNMQNFSLLKAVGRTHRPILLKRGMSSSLDEMLQATEYILAEGNQQVILCERGIRTFETATRSTLDISAVPVLRRMTHLPIIVDPSHAAGERDLVPPLAMASKAVGAHGIIVEFHPDPENALSDGPQALRFPQFARMMADLSRL